MEVKATWRPRTKTNLWCPMRELASVATQCRILRKKAQKNCREFDARMGASPRDKIVKNPVVTKLWVNGRATEDREEWSEEVRSHCEKCYDDKSETWEMQAERINAQRCRGDNAVAIPGRRMQITIDRGLRARGKMRRGKSSGPTDCLVVEKLSRLPTEVIFEVTHWFQKRFPAVKVIDITSRTSS